MHVMYMYMYVYMYHCLLVHVCVQVMKTCREMGIKTVAIYSDADTQAVSYIHVYKTCYS